MNDAILGYVGWILGPLAVVFFVLCSIFLFRLVRFNQSLKEYLGYRYYLESPMWWRNQKCRDIVKGSPELTHMQQQVYRIWAFCIISIFVVILPIFLIIFLTVFNEA